MSLEGVLSMAEADRVVVIGQVADKCLRQREAARRLGVSVRQVKRLLARYRERGPAGLVSGHLGKVSNNAMAAVVRRAAMDLVRERYADFGPTFACEKLVEVHGYRLSVETLRKWMVAEGIWRAKARRAARVHQSRPRRECVGDLVRQREAARRLGVSEGALPRARGRVWYRVEQRHGGGGAACHGPGARAPRQCVGDATDRRTPGSRAAVRSAR